MKIKMEIEVPYLPETENLEVRRVGDVYEVVEPLSDGEEFESVLAVIYDREFAEWLRKVIENTPKEIDWNSLF